MSNAFKKIPRSGAKSDVGIIRHSRNIGSDDSCLCRSQNSEVNNKLLRASAPSMINFYSSSERR